MGGLLGRSLSVVGSGGGEWEGAGRLLGRAVASLSIRLGIDDGLIANDELLDCRQADQEDLCRRGGPSGGLCGACAGVGPGIRWAGSVGRAHVLRHYGRAEVGAGGVVLFGRGDARVEAGALGVGRTEVLGLRDVQVDRVPVV